MDDDARLMQRVQSQDLAALGEIYDRYAVRIYNYLYHYLGDRQLAEDLTGDVFLKMVEAARSARFAQTSLSGWLFRIAHNLVYDYHRYRPPATESLDEGLLETDYGPVSDTRVAEAAVSPDEPLAAVERQLAQDGLRTALNDLTEDQRQVILLRFAEDLPAETVAEVLGKTEGAVWSLQHRALAALRRMLEGVLI